LIDQLPENQKVVFILYAIEGYSHKEISAELKIPIGTSKSYLSRGRNSLQKQIRTSYLKKNESI
jgi:RNA polymerase sigma-70 factor (ECF subfamily)